jgi:hypothetical protein
MERGQTYGEKTARGEMWGDETKGVTTQELFRARRRRTKAYATGAGTIAS